MLFATWGIDTSTLQELPRRRFLRISVGKYSLLMGEEDGNSCCELAVPLEAPGVQRARQEKVKPAAVESQNKLRIPFSHSL